jgi:hypothetical protein
MEPDGRAPPDRRAQGRLLRGRHCARVHLVAQRGDRGVSRRVAPSERDAPRGIVLRQWPTGGIEAMQRSDEGREVDRGLVQIGEGRNQDGLALKPPVDRPLEPVPGAGPPVRERGRDGEGEERGEPREPGALLDQGGDLLRPARQPHDHHVAQSVEGVVGPKGPDWCKRQLRPVGELRGEQRPNERHVDVEARRRASSAALAAHRLVVRSSWSRSPVVAPRRHGQVGTALGRHGSTDHDEVEKVGGGLECRPRMRAKNGGLCRGGKQ